MLRSPIHKVHEQFLFHLNRPGFHEAAEYKHYNQVEARNTTRNTLHLTNCVPCLRNKLGKIKERQKTTGIHEQASLTRRIAPVMGM
jgi:hypothetical protein